MGDKKSPLYKLVSFRFSLLNEKHVEVLQMLEKDVSKGINSRNSIIIEALTEYYKPKEVSRDWIEETFLSKQEYREQYEKQKKEILTELYQELMKVFAGGILSKGVDRNTVPNLTEPAACKKEEKKAEEESFDIESDSTIMGNVSKWS